MATRPDPRSRYDGKKIVFSMRCAASNTSTIDGVPACTGHWNIWEYDMTGTTLTGTFRRITSSNTSDDVDPAYLPAGRGFVFSSNRQTQTFANQALADLLRARRVRAQRVFNLHTMDANGGNITQISFNHEPRPQPGGAPERRHHVLALGARGRPQPLRDLPRQARRHRHVRALRRPVPGNSFLHPRDMDPRRPYAARCCPT